MRICSFLVLFLSILFAFVLSSCSSSLGEKKKELVVHPAGDSIEVLMMVDSIEFCGEMLHFNNFDIKERLDKELIVNQYRHSSTIQYLKRANRFFPQIEQLLKENGIPEDMKYLCVAESGLAQVTSRSGAKGFWQFMPATAKEFNLVLNQEVDERLHIEKSTNAACEYLTEANEKFNDWLLTAAAYNRGQGGIERDIENQHVNNYFDLHLTEETSRYVFRILALKMVMENPEFFGFSLDESSLYDPVNTKSIEVDHSISDLALWAKENGTTYRMIKLLNPWVLKNKLTIKSNKYTLLLPE